MKKINKFLYFGFLFLLAVGYLLIPQSSAIIGLIVLVTIVIGGAYLYDPNMFDVFWKKK
jgi:hypothetical protein